MSTIKKHMVDFSEHDVAGVMSSWDESGVCIGVGGKVWLYMNHASFEVWRENIKLAIDKVAFVEVPSE